MNTIIRSVLVPSAPGFLSIRPLTAFAVAAFVTISHQVIAAPGDLDLTFGGTGKVTTSVGSFHDSGQAVAVQNDGKIVMAGYVYQNGYDFAVVRYNADGSLDSTFNGTGKATTDFSTVTSNNDDIAQSVAMQSDGKIVVAGSSYDDIAVARYNTDGSLDTSFNGTGKVTTTVGDRGTGGFGVALQSDGKIVVIGHYWNGNDYDFALVRYNGDGSLDTSFNGTGKVTTGFGSGDDYAYSIAVQSDERIVVAGRARFGGTNNIALVRYNVNGSLDLTFNGSGKLTTAVGGNYDAANSVAVQSDGKIVVAGANMAAYPTSDVAVFRYDANGSLDLTFNGTGKVVSDIAGGIDEGHSLVVQDDGKIVVAGVSGSLPANSSTRDFALLRFNPDGSLDTSLNGTGKVTTPIGSNEDDAYSVAVQSDGKIVVAGQSYIGSTHDFAVVRYEGELDTDGDGIPDRFETGTGAYVSPTNTGTSPTNSDSDGDGLYDGQEVNIYHSDPNVRDTDGDGFDDGAEVSSGFSPTSATSTPEAWSTILTAVEYRFNAANGIAYRIETSTDLANWTTIETNIIGTGGVIIRFYSIEGQTRRFFRSRRN
jgi:uncharacterized delta-60 repeat protein